MTFTSEGTNGALTGPSNSTPSKSELKRYIPANTSTLMFVAALFIIAKSAKNPKVHQLTNG